MQSQSLYASNLSTRSSNAYAILQSLNSLNPTTSWETNEKTLNTVFVNTAFVDMAPNATQTNQILQIAQQCSADGGPVVFRARAWYRMLTGINIEVNCNGVIERSADEGIHNPIQQLTISPNPAQNNLQVRMSGIFEGDYQLDIFDISGRLRQSIKIPLNSEVIEISTLDFKNGIYYCRLKEGGRTIRASKFSILH